jgi:hypothetical protein
LKCSARGYNIAEMKTYKRRIKTMTKQLRRKMMHTKCVVYRNT